jgi:parallel beta-helix repeat protein
MNLVIEHKQELPGPSKTFLQNYELLKNGAEKILLKDVLKLIPEFVDYLIILEQKLELRAPRPGAQSATASDAIVGKFECDLTQVLALLNAIKKCIQNLQDITCDKFEQTWTILGEIDQDIFDTRTILCAKFEGTFTTLNNIEQEIIDTRTILCDKFEQTWTILGEIDQDIFDTRTILCDKFEQTWTILGEIDQDIFDTRTILCAKFEGTFTALDTIEEEVVDTRTILCDKLIQVLNTLPSLEGCDTNVIQISSAPFVISSPGVYCLTQNISTIGIATGITINSSNVVLDLNDYEIVGNNAGTGILISEALENIQIKNGTVRNFSIGVFIVSPEDSVVSKIVIKSLTTCNNTLHGFLLTRIEDILLRQCRSYNNMLNGFLFSDSSICILESCMANDNNSSGYFFNNNRNAELKRSSSYNNGLNGVVFSNSSQSLVDSCVSNDNSNGFQLLNCESITIRKSEAKNNSIVGFSLDASTANCHLRGNSAIANGIGFVQAALQNQIFLNYATNNSSFDYILIPYTRNPASSPRFLLSQHLVVNIEGGLF